MPKRNTMDDLRDHCFEALERLKEADDDELEKEIRRSKAISDLTAKLVDTAKVEITFQRVAGEAMGETKRSRLLLTD